MSGKYECEICGQEFESPQALGGHVSGAHSEKENEYVCPSCGKKFSNQNKYAGHRHWCNVSKEEKSRILSKRAKEAWKDGKLKIPKKLIEKREAYLYKKGHTPWNKGKRYLQQAISAIDKEKWIKEDGKWRPAKSKELSYVLGVLYGDGCVTSYKRGDSNKQYRLRLKTADEIFADKFKESLKEIGLKNIRKYQYELFWIETDSLLFVRWFQSLDLDDVREEVKNHKMSFIRGFYDSDGSTLHGANGITNCCIINTNLPLLKLTADLLASFDFETSLSLQEEKGKLVTIRGKIYVSRKDLYILRILGGRKERKRFLQSVKPVIERKRWNPK